MQIAIVGLGRMGMNMCLRLLQKGHKVVAYNRSPEKPKPSFAGAPRGSIPLKI